MVCCLLSWYACVCEGGITHPRVRGELPVFGIAMPQRVLSVCVVVAWVVALVCCEGRRRSLARPRETDPAGCRLRVAGRAGGGRECGQAGRAWRRKVQVPCHDGSDTSPPWEQAATRDVRSGTGHRPGQSEDRSCDRSRLGVLGFDRLARCGTGLHTQRWVQRWVTHQGGIGSRRLERRRGGSRRRALGRSEGGCSRQSVVGGTSFCGGQLPALSHASVMLQNASLSWAVSRSYACVETCPPVRFRIRSCPRLVM